MSRKSYPLQIGLVLPDLRISMCAQLAKKLWSLSASSAKSPLRDNEMFFDP